MPHEFVHATTLARRLALGVAASSLLTLAACSGETSSQRAGFPMAEVPRFNQPPPDKPLLGQPVITAEQVMPHAKGDPHEPLPAAAPLPARASEPASGSGATNKEDAGGVNPAAGQAAAITDGQGEGSKYELGAPK
ncbi:hypothetical protein ACF8PL_28105 [Delftia sp. WSY_4]|jgi:hypothetical protein|uniref:hypothetical protein n=1 Tax=Delftia TaxID=80865 RepID=UPI0004DA0BDB|nr:MULTISPECIES: hypothetical protein [Delftia]KEH12108.1 hypothetical protein GY15_23505 [Delftia sp. 670]KLO56841.1 hypothetical protein AA671_24990 [Delftia tsuruhatensis]MCO5336932.1 hypothetical protein [Delftia tsuruhatensis]MCR4546233.1 hypothetical protein [Delftia tsuruhatensis]MDH0421945.1 hypothetical protein [Delftia tsuruhatensis]